MIHLYFKVQEIFDDDLISFIFTHIINQDGLITTDDNQGLQFKFRMIKQSKRELLSMYNSNEYYLGAEQGILLMEMAYSF